MDSLSISSSAAAAAVGTRQVVTIFNFNTTSSSRSFFNPIPLRSLKSSSRTKRRRRSSFTRQQRLLVIRSCSSNYDIQHQLSSFSSSSASAIEYLFQLFAPPTATTTALGFTTSALAAAAAILFYNSNTTQNENENENENEIGEWRLFTSPTPFNRFLAQRCPSLLLHHDSGPILHTHNELLQQAFLDIKYQRRCISTPDGGVLSLDWPSHFDDHLTYQHDGLDTTVLIVPGTPDGSTDPDVTSFVSECLNRGCFPVVMNPRGCARSPLTNPRLFTAADSDDVDTAVHFINRARPWTSLMAVGFGYGANMLTKYLAEVGEDTPLTAATCLDNPFDLTVPPPDQHSFTDGFIEILQSNKEFVPEIP